MIYLYINVYGNLEGDSWAGYHGSLIIQTPSDTLDIDRYSIVTECYCHRSIPNQLIQCGAP